ncbi:MAG: type II secretion system F family protein [Nanoarchaeota archaeon]|nr:type II secretion system F family protein [Nanoarchaeota archaeon]
MKTKYYLGILIGLLLAGADYYFFKETRYFYAGIVVAILVVLIWPFIDFIKELQRQKDIELLFLEFSRNLVEAIKSGITLPRAILYVSNKDYRALNPYIKKLASQVELGIPVRTALWTFAQDTRSPVIRRSISIMNEAERSGGDIKDVLDSIVESVLQIKKLKEERKTGVYSQIMQGYLVYFIFIITMLVMQLWLFPKLTNIAGNVETGLAGANLKSGDLNMDKIFFSLLMIQGFFAGIMIGKFSEGTWKQGLFHSFILMALAALIITLAKGGI